MTQPTEELIIWANTDVNLPELAGPNKTKPIDDLINKGWDFTEKPAADEFNYILNNMGKWINWAITDIEAGTSLSTPNTLVKRDSNGDFSAGTVTADLSGNALTSSKWQTARNLAFTGFATGNGNVDGSGNVSIALSMGSGFTSSKTQNGYAYRPDGLIEQWGWVAGTEDTVISVTLPITYPNAILNLSCTARSPNTGASGSTDLAAHGDIISTSSIVVIITSSSGAYPGTNGVFWRTIGY